MEKVDWALSIAIGSFLAASASAYYARRLAVQDAKKMARKKPVVEFGRSTSAQTYKGGSPTDVPGLYVTDVTIRNIESSAQPRLIRLRARKGLLIAKYKALCEDGSTPWNSYIVLPLRESAFTSTFDLGFSLKIHGTPQHVSGMAGDTAHVSVYSLRPITHVDLSLEWEWMDGQKR